MTLVEVLLALTLFGLFSAAALVTVQNGRDTFRNATANTQLETRVARALDRVALEFLSAGVSELDPDPSTDVPVTDLLFRQATGLTGNDVDWGPQKELLLEPEAADPEDGLDNDGDGSVDEMRLVLVRAVGTAAETRIVLCRGIPRLAPGEDANGLDDNGDGLRDEPGFRLLRTDGLLRLELTLEGPLASGATTTRTLSTTIRLRN